MNLDNKKVKHKSFGTGKIIRSSESYIEIEFPSGNKKFVFPDAFAKFLTLEDDKASKKIHKLVKEKKQEIIEEEAQIIEDRDRLLRKREIKREQDKMLKSHKSHPSLQVVFWLQDDEFNKVFDEGRVFTGLIKSGAKEGQPNRLVRLNRKSTCLLTARDQDVEEKDRKILGIYMVKEDFMGKLNEDGYIPSHSDHIIRLSDKESEKMLFWNYYANERYPDKMTWNTGRYRYFENLIAGQILRDIVSIKDNPEEKKAAQSFFDYFCKMNLIDKDKLPEANGVLKRI